MAMNSKATWLDDGVMCPSFEALTDHMPVRPACSECLFYEVRDEPRAGWTFCTRCHASEQRAKKRELMQEEAERRYEEEAEKRKRDAEQRNREVEQAERYHEEGMRQH